MFRQCFQYNLVIVVLNIQIVIPSSSEIMLYAFRFLDYSENFIFPIFFQFLVGTFYYVLSVVSLAQT